MKMAVLLRRSTFRDYYDIYSILKSGADLREMATVALKYSGHLITTKNLLAMLTDCSRFVVDKKFAELQPRYNVSPKEIEQFIKSRVSNHY